MRISDWSSDVCSSELLGIGAGQIAVLELELAMPGNGVDRDAALDGTDLGRAERHIEGGVEGAGRAHVVGQLADVADQLRRVFDGVQALGDRKSTRLNSSH